MKCDDARRVWNHQDGYLAGLREHLPGVLEDLERKALAFTGVGPGQYDAAINAQVGGDGYYVEHALDTDRLAEQVHDVVGDLVGRPIIEAHLTALVGQPVSIGNICCKGCIVFLPGLSPELLERIQVAAVNTEPESVL